MEDKGKPMKVWGQLILELLKVFMYFYKDKKNRKDMNKDVDNVKKFKEAIATRDTECVSRMLQKNRKRVSKRK